MPIDKNRTVTIDIEGVIGIAEHEQWDTPGDKISTFTRLREVLTWHKSGESEQVSIYGDNDPGKTPPRTKPTAPKTLLVINIRSIGGDVNEAMLMYDFLCSLDCDVVTRCYGYCASAATVIAQAASPGMREVSANALYLIHRCTTSAEGNAQEIERSAGMLEKTDQCIAEIYARRSGNALDTVTRLMQENDGKGRWLSAKETISYGLTDRVILAEAIPDTLAAQIYNMGMPYPKTKMSLYEWLTDKIEEILDRRKKKKNVRHIDSGHPKVTDPGTHTETDTAFQDSETPLPKNISYSRENEHMEEAPGKDSNPEHVVLTPTRTKPKEDPSAQGVPMHTNAAAYFEDVRNIRNTSL